MIPRPVVPNQKFKVGRIVYLGGFTKCKVLRAEYYKGNWQYDLKATTTQFNRTFINVKEQYIEGEPRVGQIGSVLQYDESW